LCIQILLDGPGDLKFTDFGMSRIEGESIEELFLQFSEAGLHDKHYTDALLFMLIWHASIYF